MATTPRTTPPHEYAAIFPLDEGPNLWELSDSIKANGQREAIVLLDGKILDGRRRELACIRAGVKPKYRKFGSVKDDGDDPLEFVIDLNLRRRHLGEGDRKIAAARYATAKAGNPKLAKNVGESQPRQVGEVAEAPTNADASKRFDVSERDVSRAKTVLASGTPALQKAVADDSVTVSDAAKVAKEPPAAQDEAVAKVRTGKARSAAGAIRDTLSTTSGDADEESEWPTDVTSKKVPPQAKNAFELAAEFTTISRDLEKIKQRVRALGAGPAARMLNVTSINQSIENIKKAITESRPTHVCPYCDGDKNNCTHCKGEGWTIKAYFAQSPKGRKEAGK